MSLSPYLDDSLSPAMRAASGGGGSPPGVPSVSMSAASDTSISVTVTADGTETSVYFEHAASSGSYPGTEVVLTGGPGVWTGTIEGLSPHDNRYGHAKAINGDGESDFSLEANSSTFGPPGAPSNISATSINGLQATFSFTPGSDASSHTAVAYINGTSTVAATGNQSGDTFLFDFADTGTYDIVITATNAYGSADSSPYTQSI